MTCTRPSPLTADQARAARWLEQHLTRCPELAQIFDQATHTTWEPLVAFVTWASRHDLLQSLPAGKEVGA